MGIGKAIQVDAGTVAESEADIRKTSLHFFGVHTSPWVSGGMRMGMVMWKEQFLCSCFWRLLLLPRWCTNEAKNQDIDNYSANSISNSCRTGPFGCCINNIRSKRLFCSLVPIPPKILA